MALILIIEDALVSRKMIRKMLESLNHSILEAPNGLIGLEMINQYKPDGICLDLLTPELNGFQVLEALQKYTPPIPVIVITADIQKTSRQKCLELGAIAVLSKPPQVEQIQQALDQAFHSQQKDQTTNETNF